MSEKVYANDLEDTRNEYFITRYRDGENKESYASESVEILPRGDIKGFRGFIVKVIGTKE